MIDKDAELSAARDTLSFIKTVDEALAEVENKLRHMRELAIYASSGVNTYRARAYLDDEFQRLKSEIEKISLQAEINVKTLLKDD